MLVQKLRLRRGWSQQQLAELSGLSARTIQRIENGKPASAETLKSLASVFEIDFSQLTSEPSMNPTSTVHPAENAASSPPGSAPPAASRAEIEERLAFAHVRRVKGFYFHLSLYGLVIALLVAINLIFMPQHLWVLWAALGWGVGLASHAAGIFGATLFLGPNWERRQVEKRLGRPL